MKMHSFDLCATYVLSFLVFLRFVPFPLFGKGVTQTVKTVGSCHALVLPGKAGSAPSSRIRVPEAFRIDFRKGVYRYAFMNLISMGQVHVQDYIGFKAGLEYPHISAFQNPHKIISYHTALIKTAKYGWNVTDELVLKAALL